MTRQSAPPDPIIEMPAAAVAALMPMHLWIGRDGRIRNAGPAFRKMAGKTKLTGRIFSEVVDVRSPATTQDVSGLRTLAGRRMSLVLRSHPDLPLRGTVVDLPDGDGMLLDVSLGLSFFRAVALFGLTLNDFSPCDQTVELLYLFEANTSIRELSHRLSQRLEAARATAEEQALTDALTGLNNRRAMDLALERCLLDTSEEFTLLHIDLDFFKQVNDTHGHAAGDAVLARVGTILRNDLRATDIAGRVGGDEFLVILREHTPATDVGMVATRLIAAFEEPIPFEGQMCQISASIGITQSTGYMQRPSVDGILADTDVALYQAKRQGRGRFVIFSGTNPADPAGRRAQDPKARAFRADQPAP